MSISISEETIEQRLNLGVLNLWYPVLPSWRLSGKPLGITRLGENLLLWRDQDGCVHALEDRCPHRGARLSLGWNLGNRIACWYHGVEISPRGEVLSVPAVADCPLVGQKRVKSYPVEERKGAIFVYFGDALHQCPPPLVLAQELRDEENYDALLCTAKWRCNYRYAIDNVMDPMHGAYLHAKSHSMARGEKTAVMQVKKTEHGLICAKADQRDINFDWVEFADTDALWMRLSIPYGPGAGPGGPFGIIGFATPVDEHNTWVFFWRTRRVRGWVRDVWRFMYKNRLEGLHWAVLEQDRVMLENMAPAARDNEALYQHDTGLVRVRRILEQKVTTQLKALAANQPQEAAD